jgi:hypothetical protein
VILFLVVFSLFNLCAATAAFGAVAQLALPGAVKSWASQRLFIIARAACWGLGLIALWATAAGWAFGPASAPVILAPIGWLLLMGIVFAAVDFAEDGVFDFGRGAPPKPKL